MLIRLQLEHRLWRVLHPDKLESFRFHDSAKAFDFADALARLHHTETGRRSSVRVEASGAYVEAVRYG
ncbi:MAG: hypothetical protein ACN6RH_15975 [Stenotrophomonas rhizophila]|jgi:hypothetical protein|uniref:hypothetical protein n=1 Tax=Stenotrophomonas rhizophila TaxID=216778 RepID=UPI0010BFB885|nr:hypothetical protein [Stenotrophomonas rhizophila]MDY0954186.1 hypothetical protein [Stenotrophomonas rhizophila]TKK02967.1 hypothetical protein SrhCFBP13529_18785 [Stenotrophomonas rhizophila]